MKKKNTCLDAVTIIICFSLILIFEIGGFIKKRSLVKNAECTKAIVIDHFYTIRYTDYFSYVFYDDNNKEYQGSGHYYPQIDKFTVGDTIVVIYNKKNPKNNMPKREF